MASVVKYDTQTNYFKQLIDGVFLSEYQGQPDVIIYQTDPEILGIRSLVDSVPHIYLVQDSGAIREMTAGEKAVRETLEKQKTQDFFPVKTYVWRGKVGNVPVKILSGVKRFDARILSTGNDVILTLTKIGDLVAVSKNSVFAYADIIYF